jgi:CHAD domain-containing protein
MEFFISLFPPDEINYLISQLKKLQDNLGEFNDLSVQQRTMQEYLHEVDWADKNANLITASLGGLIASLNLKQQLVRQEFESIYAAFSTSENIAKFERLFKLLNS